MLVGALFNVAFLPGTEFADQLFACGKTVGVQALQEFTRSTASKGVTIAYVRRL